MDDRVHHEYVTKPNGITYLVELFADYDYGPPEAESDGHGIVIRAEDTYNPNDEDELEEHLDNVFAEDEIAERLEETARAQHMRLLGDHNRHNRCKYYDVWETRKMAAKEGWGMGNEWREANPDATKQDEVNAAVDRDFKYLDDWYCDQWHYVTVKVSRLDPETGEEEEESANCCGGYESTLVDEDRKYFDEVINDSISLVEHEHRRLQNPNQLQLDLRST
jgi:hypothetical protein